MNEEDIYNEDNQFIVKKEINGKWVTFGSFDNLDEAIELRDELEDYGWPYLDTDEPKIEEVEKFIFKENGRYIISKNILDLEVIFGNFDSLEKAKLFKRKLIDNAWNLNFKTKSTKYGKYITKTYNNKFKIVKDINGVYKSFGLFKRLDEALMVRDDLVTNNWGMDKSTILNNLGIIEVDLNMGKVGRKYTVYEIDDSKCTIYGIYRSHRLAKKVIKQVVSKRKNDLSFLDNYQEKDTKYIYRVGEYYRVSKTFSGKVKNFGHYNSLDEAIAIRDKLIENGWDDSFLGLRKVIRWEDSYNRNIHKTNRGFDVVKRIDGELINFGSFETLEEAISYRDELEENGWEVASHDDEFVEEKYDEFIFLKNDSRYYLKNEIDGESRIFGVFDNPLDAIAARLDCMKNNWELYSIPESQFEFSSDYPSNFGLLKEEVDDSNHYENSEIMFESIDFPVTVGKSYKNRGWAIKRGHLERFVPRLPYERECVILVNGRPISGKINIHTRLFYFKDEMLSDFLERLYEIDPKTQTRIDLILEHGVYKFNSDLTNDNLFFITKFSKSFKKGLFAIPRSVSEIIMPMLPYEDECKFIINEMEVRGKFNLEFRFRFSDKNVIDQLESEVDDDGELEVILLL